MFAYFWEQICCNERALFSLQDTFSCLILARFLAWSNDILKTRVVEPFVWLFLPYVCNILHPSPHDKVAGDVSFCDVQRAATCGVSPDSWYMSSQATVVICQNTVSTCDHLSEHCTTLYKLGCQQLWSIVSTLSAAVFIKTTVLHSTHRDVSSRGHPSELCNTLYTLGCQQPWLCFIISL